MPCIVYESVYESANRNKEATTREKNLKFELDKVTRLLCELMGKLDQQQLKKLKTSQGELFLWWEQHQKADALRLVAENKAKVNSEWNKLKDAFANAVKKIDSIENLGGIPGLKICKEYDLAKDNLSNFEMIHSLPSTSYNRSGAWFPKPKSVPKSAVKPKPKKPKKNK